MRNALFSYVILIVLISACGNRETRAYLPRDNEFVDEVVIKTTPVKNQGQSPLCWAYAMLATIESERLMMGDSVELSAEYYGRRLMEDETREYFFSNKRGDISMRGTCSMLINLLNRYGALPYNSFYNNRPGNYKVLSRKAGQVADMSPTLSKMKERVERLLDDNIGLMPRHVFMYGMEYTPRQFAQSVCLPGEYIALTSYTHHPFGERFVLEVPDNQMRDSFLNVSIDTLMFRVEQAICSGHPVCWEGDISEPGFNFREGRAVLMNDHGLLLNKRKEITQADRQRSFERMETTDDHCMELCGLARNRQGRRFFLAKNSWGTTGRYRGLMYLSYDYVKLKTIAFYMSRAAWEG